MMVTMNNTPVMRAVFLVGFTASPSTSESTTSAEERVRTVHVELQPRRLPGDRAQLTPVRTIIGDMSIVVPPRGTRGFELPRFARMLMRVMQGPFHMAFGRFGDRMRVQ